MNNINKFYFLAFFTLSLSVISFLTIKNVYADIGPIDSKSQDVEHNRNEHYTEKKENDYVKLSKSKYTPENLNVISVGENKVILNWEDNAKQEIGYYVERKNAGGAWKLLAKIGKNSKKYNDLTVVSGTAYKYRVKAFNAKTETLWSNEVFVKTKGVSPEEKRKKEEEETLKKQEKKLKKEFEITLKKEIENVKTEILSKSINTCSLKDVSAFEVDKAFRERCEKLSGKQINIDKPTTFELIKNKLLYDSKHRLIAAMIILFIIMNNVFWHIKHKTVKYKLKGEC